MVACRASVDCGAARFCSLPGGTCVSPVKAVSAGTSHTCSLHEDGAVFCWGYGAFIGPGLPAVTGPVRIASARRATAVVVGIQAACALVEQGNPGAHREGNRVAIRVQLLGRLRRRARATPAGGDGERRRAGRRRPAGGGQRRVLRGRTPRAPTAGGTTRPPSWPGRRRMIFPPLTAVLSQPGRRPLIAATVAILVHDGGSQLCGWGNNDSGLVPGPRGIAAQPSCSDAVPGVQALTAGDGHVCARRGGDRFTCWGSNSGGQLGHRRRGRAGGGRCPAQAAPPARRDRTPSPPAPTTPVRC